MKLKGHLEINPDENLITYRIKDIEEPITKQELRKWKEWIGGDCTLKTNAGVEIHSSEMCNGKWNGIKIERL